MPAPRLIVLDNYDSFTFTLVDYLRSAGAEVEVVRNDATDLTNILERSPGGFLISPGPGHPNAAGLSVALAAACIVRGIPLLGVCLGHQAIALACDQEIKAVPPMHGKVATVRHDGTGLFTGLKSPLAQTRYHSLAAVDPQPPLLANAWSNDGVVMAMRHASAPVHGLQFHPESVASTHGHDLIRGFVRLCA